MKILSTFYYSYYLFYKNILKDPEPHVATILSLSFSESLLMNGLIDIIALKYYCYEIKVIVQFALTILIVFINYFFYHKSGRNKIILKEKPILARSKVFSITITILFFLITASWLFWGSIYGKYLLERCR
jgi:hypothetical protein